MTQAYWHTVGGTLYRELVIGRRRIDGVILPDGPTIEAPTHASINSVPLSGHRIITVQTKTGRPVLPLLGQALLSSELIEAHQMPSSITRVAICGRDDSVLFPLAHAFGIDIRVQVTEDSWRSSSNVDRDKNRDARLLCYWNSIGGTLITRFPLVTETPTNDAQYAHGIILPHGPQRHMQGPMANPGIVEGQEAILVHTSGGVGMYVLGQAIFGRELLQRHGASSVQSVVVCAKPPHDLAPSAIKWDIKIVLETSL